MRNRQRSTPNPLVAYVLAAVLTLVPVLALRLGGPIPPAARGAHPPTTEFATSDACIYPRPPTAVPTPTPVPRPAHVLSTYPIDNDSDVNARAPLQIVFDQAMDTAPGSTRYTISPAVLLEPEWPAPDRLVLRGEGWQPGVAYHLRLESARSRRGGALAKPVTLTFARGGMGAPIPILMYHSVMTLPEEAPQVDRDCAVSPREFAAQLDLLDELDAHVVSIHDVVDYLVGGESLPPRPIVLTFDDGNANVYRTAVPLMRAHGVTATLYIIISAVGASGYMDWDELRELAAEGYVLGSHSHNHPVCSGLSAQAAGLQLEGSRQMIERQVGCAVRTFAYPYGVFTAETIGQLEDCGYEAALAIGPSVYQSRSQRMAMPRVFMSYGDPLSKLRAYLSAWEFWPDG